MTSPQPLWRGRALAMLGIVLVAFSLRSAVASLSPVIDLIDREVPLSAAVLGVIGAAPPVCFAVFGLLTPIFERRFGLERVAVVALVVMTSGLLLRAFAVDSTMLLVATAVVFAGVGTGNVLLPPLVKKYFADRLGIMMSVYSTVMAVSTFLPPLVAVPLADSLGWRASLGIWGVFAVIAVVPWVLMLVNEDAAPRAASAPRPPLDPASVESTDGDAAALATGPITTNPPNPRVFRRLWGTPLAWALACVFGVSSSMAYASFAWLPAILVDIGGVTPATAGLLLSVFAAMGLPVSLIVPVLVVRFQATRALFLVAVVVGLAGLAGLLLAPTAALAVWVILFGFTAILFPLSLVLLSIRSRSAESAVALSGFVQSIGYALAALAPLLVGVLHETTGDWQVPLLLLAGALVISIPAGWVAGRARTVEDEWEAREAR